MRRAIGIILSILVAITFTLPATAFSSVALKSIKLNAASVTLDVKKTFNLKVTLTPANTSQKMLGYTTSNKNVAKVDKIGKITAVAPGKATITVTSTANKSITAKCEVIVNSATTYSENGLSKTKKVNLKLAFFQGGVGRAWLDYAVKTFTKKFPNVKISVTASPTIETIIQPKISAGNDEDMFDIISTTRLPWEELADAEKIISLDDLWERSPYDTSGKKLKDLVLDSSYKYQRFRRLGHSYTIDFSIDILGLFYDKSFFKKNGWNTQPKTYDEFIKLCDAIKAKGIYPMTFYKGYQWGLFKPKVFELALANGNTSFDHNFRNFIGPQYTAPENLTMWTRMYEMGKKKYFEPGSGTITNMVSQMQVLQHRVAMVASGSWIQNEMKNATPAGFEWGFMAMPFVDKPTQKICVQQTAEDSFFIWADKPDINKKWAKEFVLWMQNLDVQAEIVKSGMMSIREDFSNSRERVAKIQGVCKSIMDIMATKRVISVDISTRDVTLNDPDGYGDTAYSMADDARVAVALGKKDPKPILEKAEELLQKAVETGIKKN